MVDDAPVNRRVLRSILRQAQAEVLEAEDGEAALALCREQRPALVLLDVLMPGLDGFAVCERLKADPATAEIPVIFLSALDRPDDKVRGLELGAADYVTKPFDPAEVLARVRTQLRLHELTAALYEKQRQQEADLRAAAEVQRALLPPPELRLPGLSAARRYEPAQTIGGDLLGVIPLGLRHVGLFVLDVSGHGVPSALVAAIAARNFAPEAGLVVRADGTPAAPAEVLARLDGECPFERFERFLTAAYAVIDVDTGRLRCASAGHPPGVLQRLDGTLDRLERGGGILGVGLGPYEQDERVLEPGDRLFLFTDGLTEHRGADGTQLGQGGVEARIGATADWTLAEAAESVLLAARAHGHGAPFADDAALLAVEYTGLLDGPHLQMALVPQLAESRRACAALRRLGARAGWPEALIAELELATAEGVVNAVRHGRPPLRFSAAEARGAIELRFADAGPGPDPERLRRAAEAPDDPLALAEGGRGLELLAALADELKIEPRAGGHDLVLRKRRG